MNRVLGLVASAAGGLDGLRAGLLAPLVERGWTVAVTLTPTAGRWLAATGEDAAIARLTGLPVRSASRLPHEPRPHPEFEACAVVPASATTVARLALGIGDSQALTVACEAVGRVPVAVVPRVNAANTRHPAWAGHLAALRSAGVTVLHGEDFWPPHEPRETPAAFPWDVVVEAVDGLVSRAGGGTGGG